MSGPPDGPFVIGGLGGSGTRLVARIVIDAGVDLGRDLNDSLDHLGFTLLFKRPRWLDRAERERPAELDRAFSILERSMRGGAAFDRHDRGLLRRAAFEIALRGHDARGRGRGIWPFVRKRRLLAGRPPSAARAWGWKEPNSHVLLDHLIDRFPRLRFAYVARNGLDMAYSTNRTQLDLWGPRFGVLPTDGEAAPRALLHLWIRAGERARALGERLGERFLWIDYDRLCLAPHAVIPSLLRWCDVDADAPTVDALARRVKPPSSLGRHRGEDLSWVGEEEARAVERLGKG
ncbi:MAG: sulfotransferase [Planctomycetota bacterium JB042]